jgi:hypothetical protein
VDEPRTFEESEEQLVAQEEQAAQEAVAAQETADRAAAEDALNAAGDETAEQLRALLNQPPPESAPKNLRERVDQRLELLQGIYGDESKDKARERAMNLAMIGLAIAAGQSPNALTNIAQGTLAGTQAMQRAQSADREREDALRTTALESVLGEEASEQKFQRDMRLVMARARAEFRAGRPLSDHFGNIYAETLKMAQGNLLDVPKGMSNSEYANMIAQLAVQHLQAATGGTPSASIPDDATEEDRRMLGG